MKSSNESRAAALTAADIRRHVDELFEQGHVLGDDGSRTPLHPHALAQVDARELTALAVSENVGATLEVGLGLGVGTLSLCTALLEVGRPGARHVVVEPFPDDFGGAGTRTVRAAGAGDLVEEVHAESQLALPKFAAEGRSFDLALIDGDHRTLEPRQDKYDDWHARTQAEIKTYVWSHPSIEHSFFKNSYGEIHGLSPWRLVDYWAWTREPDLADFEIA